MKPKIGDKIYTIYYDQIYLEVVGFLGANSFLVEGYEDKTGPEYYYEEYNERWFRSFDKAAKKLRKKYGRKFKTEQITEDTWECYEEEN